MEQRFSEPPESGATAKDGPASRGFRVLPVRPYLFLVLECDRPRAGGARYALGDIDEVVIGRGRARAARAGEAGTKQLIVKVPGRAVSGTHARIRRAGPDWALEDLESTNGSYVNGKRVTSMTLADGDAIELGHTLFTIRSALPTPAGTVPIFDPSDTPPPARGLATLLPALESRYVEMTDVARSGVSISLSGRSGTGKEVLAEAIHSVSGRPGPFVAVNCGALPANLVEGLLFGHVKGAFSGAIRDEPGFLRGAHQGTLFLDEIGELPASAQVALLRVVQDAKVVPVGSSRPVPVDLRIISATHEPLARLVAQGKFREDLQARIDGYSFDLPDLVERREDLGLIVAALLEATNADVPSLAGSAGRRLYDYGWPLNIRELEQALRRAVALTKGGPLGREHLPQAIGGGRTDGAVVAYSSAPPGPLATADERLRRELVEQLEQHRGNVSAVAEAMGKARTQIQRWMQRFGIDVAAYRKSRPPPAQ